MRERDWWRKMSQEELEVMTGDEMRGDPETQELVTGDHTMMMRDQELNERNMVSY